MLENAGAELIPDAVRRRRAALPDARAARDAFLRYRKGRHPDLLNLGECASYEVAKEHAPLLSRGYDFAQTNLLPAA
ncbi:type II toxin-antitoxin system VapC family toxin [Rhodopila sp.]|uniref:type II toxin-antitoxin system VapC family toxin n=1 Tax=Rhodopila sp. TaxID=2480087 RepID=UPI003D0C42DD